SLSEKEEYIIKKLSPFFGKYVLSNNIPRKVLYDVLETFNTISDKRDVSVKERTTINFSTQKEEEVKVTDQDIQEKIFEGIRNDTNPIDSLRKDDKFANL